MTAYSMTVTNSVRFFGEGPSSLWNAYSWNAFKWGEGTATIPHQVRHLIQSAISPNSSMSFRVVHLIQSALAPDSSVNFVLIRLITNQLAITSDMSSEVLQNGGYDYVFPDRTTEGERRSTAVYSSSTVSTPSWASQAVATTTWS